MQGRIAAVELLEEWTGVLSRLGAAPDPRPGRSLLTRYAEPHRRYHTVEHLTAVLTIVDRLAADASRPDVVRLAAWYHDAIYDPRRQDNEERSAALAEDESAALGLPPTLGARVALLVLLTAEHDPPPGDTDTEVLCDADLAVLAAPAAVYDGYAAAVRQENGHVDAAGWRAGRSAVLRTLLGRPRLFRTATAAAWEAAARRNISRELAALDAAGAAPPP